MELESDVECFDINKHIANLIAHKLKEGLIVIESGSQTNDRGCSPYAMFNTDKLYFYKKTQSIVNTILHECGSLSSCDWRNNKLYFGEDVTHPDFGEGDIKCDPYVIVHGTFAVAM